MSDSAWFGVCVVVLLVGALCGAALRSTIAQQQLDKSRNECCTQGDHRGGGRLVRGQDDSYICIDPRAVKWERR